MRAASALVVLGALLAGCGGPTIVPDYRSTSEHLQVGGKRPPAAEPVVEDAGVFCLEVSERWHEDGETPDGQPLWARDTLRKVVPCP
jgi:hypothetical protein